VLASASPRRRALLDGLGIAFRSVEPGVEERAGGAPAGEVAVALALAKAREVARRLRAAFAPEGDPSPAPLVIGADTLVVLDGTSLGKPRDGVEAVRMLLLLSGRDHEVITGIAVVDSLSGREASAREMTVVRMRAFDEAEARAYVATGEPLDKAGAYGIQGYGGLLVEGIRGDYYNVVGLPLARLRSLLLGF
jgi:septum formation protein